MKSPPINTIRIGYIGEQMVIRSLLEMNLNCYVPVVDDDGRDMIVEVKNGFKRVQVKTSRRAKTTSGTSVEVRMRNEANKDRVDVVAIYYMPDNIIAYYPYNNEEVINLAIRTAKNKQTKGRDWFYKYMEFPYEK